jgi:hypothetical protein
VQRVFVGLVDAQLGCMPPSVSQTIVTRAKMNLDFAPADRELDSDGLIEVRRGTHPLT